MSENEQPTNVTGTTNWTGTASLRIFAVLFFAGATVLATACWLRPALSPDLRSYHLSLGLLSGAPLSPEQILEGPRQVPADSAGLAIMAVVLLGLGWSLWQPRWLGIASGILLCAAAAANAAVAFNQPTLTEMLDYEYEQRRQIASVSALSPQGLPMTTVSTPMAKAQNGRIGLAGAPSGDEQRGDLTRGWVYLLYGLWLIPWAAAGVLLGARGPLTERAAKLVLWSFAAFVAAGAICSQRLSAEYCWRQALAQESRADYSAARNSLQAAVSLMPEFASLERTWLLTGKLDFHENRSTPERQFFCAYQLSRNRTRPRAIAYAQDMPWFIVGVQDFREGQENVPTGIDKTMGPGETETGTRDLHKSYHRRDDLYASVLPSHVNQATAAAIEVRYGLHVMDELLAEKKNQNSAVRHQASRLWTNVGLIKYLQSPRLSDAGMIYQDQNVALTTIQQSWARAAEIDPANRYGLFFLGMAQARAERMSPETAEASFTPVLKGTADKALKADIWNVLGDAYFEAGQQSEARRCYLASFDIFNFPSFDNINYRAARKLGGL